MQITINNTKMLIEYLKNNISVYFNANFDGNVLFINNQKFQIDLCKKDKK